METTQKWQLPRIGSKFTGKPKGCNDTENGTYWEVLPTIQGDMLKLQTGLTKRKPVPKASRLPTLASNGFLAIIFRKFWAWC